MSLVLEETATDPIVAQKLERYRFLVEYDGSDYFGWQLQPEVRTIQSELEAALHKLFGRQIRVNGAGRTDTGVHALGQVAHFEATPKYTLEKLHKALNYFLPRDIRVVAVSITDADFHARFSARWRWYQYRIFLKPRAIERNYGWQPRFQFNPDLLQRAAVLLLGEHDFSSFSGTDPETDNYRCTVYRCCWEHLTAELRFHIVANRFLRHLVRRLVGSMLEMARGRYSFDYFVALLDNPAIGSNLFTAPAPGLCLLSVGYSDFPLLEPDSEKIQEFPFALTK